MRNDMTEKNKQTVRRIFDDYINRSMPEVLPELVAADYLGVGGDRGPAAFSGPLQALLLAVPDVHFTLEDLLAEGDSVAVRWTWSGTNTGAFRGFAPSNKHVEDSGIAIYKLRDGKIVSSTIQTDRLGFLQQIGVIPAIPGVSAPSPK